jgi:hypothetical protein
MELVSLRARLELPWGPASYIRHSMLISKLQKYGSLVRTTGLLSKEAPGLWLKYQILLSDH